MHGLKSSFPSTCRLYAFDVVVILAFHFTSERHAMRSLFVLTFALLMIACGDGGRRSEDQFSNPLYPSVPEQDSTGAGLCRVRGLGCRGLRWLSSTRSV